MGGPLMGGSMMGGPMMDQIIQYIRSYLLTKDLTPGAAGNMFWVLVITENNTLI